MLGQERAGVNRGGEGSARVGSKPGVRAVLAVGISKTLFEDLRFTPSPEGLQQKDREQQQEKGRAIQIEDQSCQRESRENIDGIADLRIQAMGNERAGLRSDGEGIPKLNARKGEKEQTGSQQEQANNVHRAPGSGRSTPKKGSNREERNHGNEQGARFHCPR